MNQLMNTHAPTVAGMAITTVRYGTPEVVIMTPAALYTFPEAMPGLEESHRFALLGDADTAPFRWLQSLDEAPVCLPVLGLDVLPLEGYAGEVAPLLPETDQGLLAASILVVCRFDAATEGFVANLLAPIVLDPRTATGRQVILEGQPYPLRQPLRWDAGKRVFVPC